MASVPGAFPDSIPENIFPVWEDESSPFVEPCMDTTPLISQSEYQRSCQLPHIRSSEPMRRYHTFSSTSTSTLASQDYDAMGGYSRDSRDSRDEPSESTGLLATLDGHVEEYDIPRRTMSYPGSDALNISPDNLRAVRRVGRGKGFVYGDSPLDYADLCIENAALGTTRGGPTRTSDRHSITMDRLRDKIAAGERMRKLHSQKGIRPKLQLWSDPAAEFVLILLIGLVTAGIAFGVNVMEIFLFDLKEGHCASGWYQSRRTCCSGSGDGICDDWRTWSHGLPLSSVMQTLFDFAVFNAFSVALAAIACYITLRSMIKPPLPASALGSSGSNGVSRSHNKPVLKGTHHEPAPHYSAAGSGVAEIKVILGGFLLPGRLGIKTLLLKMVALVPSSASGLSLGKEGPFVHIAACVGDVLCTVFATFKDNLNETKRREIISTCAACGVSVAFGAPFAGVFFTIEEAGYHITSRTLLRAFLCCIVATSSLKFLDPYGTGEALIFRATYSSTWSYGELPLYISLGILGGALGALLVKLTALWSRLSKGLSLRRRWPLLEVVMVAFLTSAVGFWNDYLRLPSVQLISKLTRPSSLESQAAGFSSPETSSTIRQLAFAFIIKAVLTPLTLGLTVPAGVYIPSLVLGGLIGRIVGHMAAAAQLIPHSSTIGSLLHSEAPHLLPGICALLGAFATLSGVTRLTATSVVALVELSDSGSHVVPFFLAILCAKWTATALAPLGLYDALIHAAALPYLDSKSRPVFPAGSDLADLVRPLRPDQLLDLSKSPVVPTGLLRVKLARLLSPISSQEGSSPQEGDDNHEDEDEDEEATLALVRDGRLHGLADARELSRALQRAPRRDATLCLLASDPRWDAWVRRAAPAVADLTPLVVATADHLLLDVDASLLVVYECFAALGMRWIRVVKEGRLVGLVYRRDLLRRANVGGGARVDWE